MSNDEKPDGDLSESEAVVVDEQGNERFGMEVLQKSGSKGTRDQDSDSENE